MYVEVINLNIHSLSFRNTSLHLYDSLIMKSLHSHDYIYTVIFSKIHLRPVFPWPVVCRTSIHPSMFVIFIDTKLSVFKHQTFGDVKRIFPSQNVSGHKNKICILMESQLSFITGINQCVTLAGKGPIPVCAMFCWCATLPSRLGKKTFRSHVLSSSTIETTVELSRLIIS